MATIAQLRSGLAKSTVPDDVAKALLKGASPLWLSSDTAVQLAEDLALCHPELKPNEVRARAVAGDDMWRLTVVAHDRKGLLADTAAFLAVDGYSVRAASVATWKELDLAYHALTVDGPVPADDELNRLGTRLQAANRGKRPQVVLAPVGRAYVKRTGDANGAQTISVVAPDQPGLLAAITRWLSDRGVSIQAAWIAGDDEAHDTFVVSKDVDVVALEKYLSAPGEAPSLLDTARNAGESVVHAATDFVRGLLTRR